MKYIHVFENTEDYDAYVTGGHYIEPSFCFIKNDTLVKYHPYFISVGDIAYWDGSAVCTVTQSEWNTSLGTPVGVVVIPEGMLPDGKARMVGLKYATSAGTSSDSTVSLTWGGYSIDTVLTNYTRVPTTDNAGSTSTGADTTGYLPSDNFTGATSFVDSTAKYYTQASNLIPSPYLGNNRTFNPEYSEAISGYNNALSDFDGLGNTQTLVGLGTGYTAANACWNYDGGVSGTGVQWYLPAAGELGFLIPRFNAINEAITTVGGVAVASDVLWSSSEISSDSVYLLNTRYGSVSNSNKRSNPYVRPFAVLA